MRTTRYLFLLACVLTVFVAGAQEPFKREFAIGFGGGATFSRIGFTPKVEQSFQPGLTGGVTVRWITNKNLGLTAEINFAQQGWKENIPASESGIQYRYSRTANYVELPFMTHIYAGSNRARFVFHIGPKIGYLISESTDENLGGAEPNNQNIQHNMPIENKLDWGVCGGPGIEIRTGIGMFVLEGRFYMALGNIYGNSKADYFPKSNGTTLSAKLTYLINIR